MITKTYILFSGGRESLINLHEESFLKTNITLVIFDYGQKSYKREFDSVLYYAKKYKCGILKLSSSIKIPEGIKDGTNKADHVVNRNLIFTSLLINHLGVSEEYKILIGTVKWQISSYHDGLKQFRTDFGALLSKLYPNVHLKSHSDNFFGHRTYAYLVKNNVDISHLWLCMDNLPKHCGKCSKCVTVRKELQLQKDRKQITFLKTLGL